MSNYSEWFEVKRFRSGFYDQSTSLYPADFKKYYEKIPIYLLSGAKATFSVTNYVSKYTADRKTHANALKAKIRDTWGADLHSSFQTWLDSKRLASTFAGHGLPEEISMIASYAAYCGYKSEGEMANWMNSVFGLDCNGFVSAYFTALKTFKKPLYYIPSYPHHAGYAKEENEITYDSVICFARKKTKLVKGDEDGDGIIEDGERIRVETKDWEVRPNPGNSAHIMVIDDWVNKWETLKVTQMSATYKLDTHLYDVVDAPTVKKKRRAVFKIRRRGSTKKIDVMISKQMPEWLGKDGKIEE